VLWLLKTDQVQAIGAAGLALACLLGVAACSDDAASTAENGPSTGTAADGAAAAIKNVRIVRPKPITVQEKIVATGSIGSKQTSNIGPLVEGVIETIHVNVGDRVSKGDPLFQTRPALYEREVDEAEANLALARAKLTNARLNYERTKKLIDEGFATQSRVDEAKTAFDVGRAETRKRDAEFKTARRNLEDTIVKAPYDGVITRRFNDEGVYLSNVLSSGPDSAVLQIQENHIVVAVVHAPEQHLKSLKLKQKALVYVESQTAPRESYVLVLNDMLDVGARAVELRLPIDNSDYSLKSGQFARAEIFTELKTVYAIPREAIFEDGGETYVLVRRGNVAERMNIVFQEQEDGNIVVEGLAPEDDIIILETEPVKAGDRVKSEAA